MTAEDEETIVKEVLDHLSCIEHSSHYPVEVIRMWVQLHTVLSKLVENPDYDWRLYFAKPIRVMVQEHPGLDYDYHRYCTLLDRIQLALARGTARRPRHSSCRSRTRASVAVYEGESE